MTPNSVIFFYFLETLTALNLFPSVQYVYSGLARALARVHVLVLSFPWQSFTKLFIPPSLCLSSPHTSLYHSFQTPLLLLVSGLVD